MNRRNFLGCVLAAPVVTVVKAAPSPSKPTRIIYGKRHHLNSWHKFSQLPRQVDVWVALRQPLEVGDLVTVANDPRPMRVVSWYIDTTRAGDGLYHVHLRRDMPPAYVRVGP